MNKKFLRVSFPFIVLSIIGLIGAPCVHADFMIKPFKGSAAITEGIYYNSNPGYADVGNRTPSWGNKLGFDLGLELPFGELHKYSLNSHTEWKKYFDDEADEWDAVNTRVSHSLDFTFNKWSLNIHQNFQYSDEPDTAELPVLGRDLLQKTVNVPGFAIRGDLGKMKLATGFDYTNYRTNDAYRILERDVYAPWLEVGVQFTPLLDGFMRYTFTNIDRVTNEMNDSKGYDVKGGLRGELTPYLVGEIAVGYAYVDYDNTNPPGSPTYGGGDSSDYSGLVYSGSVTNRLSKLTTQTLSFSLAPEPGYNVGNYYTTYTAGYDITHQLNDKLTIGGLFEYIRSQESGGAPRFKEDSDIWVLGSSFNYKLAKNLSLSAEYKYTEKESEVKRGKDYKQHAASVGLRYAF